MSFDEGKYNFNNLTSNKAVIQFFEEEFPDALKVIPNIIEEFNNNPTATLGTVKCHPWYYRDKTLLIGDAAHAIVPFYGQGMNASFEDVVVFDSILDQNLGSWEEVFRTYQKVRKQNTDAIADLAIDNFYEMRDHVANPLFKEKRKIEMDLEEHFPDVYFSKYSMVTFREDISYHEAMVRGRAQDKALLNLIADQEVSTSLNMTKEELEIVLDKINEETEEILREDKIAGL